MTLLFIHSLPFYFYQFGICFKVTCLFKKVHGSWQIEEEGYFGTDVWYEGIGNRYPDAPQGIFPSYEIYYNGN